MATRKLKRFVGEYWMGFSDGKPHIVWTGENEECVANMCKFKKHIRYEDRRLVRVTEVRRGK